VCGWKRGFVRVWDVGGVISSKTNNISKLAAEALEPLYTQHADRQTSAHNFEHAAKEAMDRTYHEGTAKERENVKPFAPQIMPAGAALASIPPQARAASRELNFPASKRYVTPSWSDNKR
jgi:hypothetical protein